MFSSRRGFLTSPYCTYWQIKLVLYCAFLLVVQQAVISHIHSWSSYQDLRWSSCHDVLRGSSRILHEELTNKTERMERKKFDPLLHFHSSQNWFSVKIWSEVTLDLQYRASYTHFILSTGCVSVRTLNKAFETPLLFFFLKEQIMSFSNKHAHTSSCVHSLYNNLQPW